MKINPIRYIAKTKAVNNFEKWAMKEKTIVQNGETSKISNYSKLQKYYPTGRMLFAGVFQAYVFAKSEDIPKKRKIPLVLNIAIMDTIALVAGIFCQKPVEKFTNTLVKRAEVVYKNNPEKSILINGIKTAVPFVVAGMLFGYVGGVIATPLADKANKYLVKKGLIKYDNQKQA